MPAPTAPGASTASSPIRGHLGFRWMRGADSARSDPRSPPCHERRRCRSPGEVPLSRPGAGRVRRAALPVKISPELGATFRLTVARAGSAPSLARAAPPPSERAPRENLAPAPVNSPPRQGGKKRPLFERKNEVGARSEVGQRFHDFRPDFIRFSFSQNCKKKVPFWVHLLRPSLCRMRQLRTSVVQQTNHEKMANLNFIKSRGRGDCATRRNRLRVKVDGGGRKENAAKRKRKRARKPRKVQRGCKGAGEKWASSAPPFSFYCETERATLQF